MKLLSLDQIDEAVSFLQRGELVAFPTETVYGLGAPVFSPSSIAKIFTAKGRPSDNPLIVHVSSVEEVCRVAIEIPELFFKLADHFFPGPLTVILKRHPQVPALVSAGLETVAVRMPAHPVALSLIKKVGEPLVAPSANLSGRPSATESKHVIDDFQDSIGAVIEGGSCEIGVESTVINLLENPPVLLRPGLISIEQIEAVLGCAVRSATERDKIASPGMKYRHYAPRAAVKLFYDQEKLSEHLQTKKPEKVFLLSDLSFSGFESFPLTAATLYSLLRKSDCMDVEEVVVFCSARISANLALMNRLSRAEARC